MGPLRIALEPANVWITALLGGVMVHWLLVAVGWIRIDALDRLLGRRPGRPGPESSGSDRTARLIRALGLEARPLAPPLSLGIMTTWLVVVVGGAILDPAGHGWLVALRIATGVLAGLATVRLSAGILARALASLSADRPWPAPLGQVCRVISPQLVSGQRGRAELPPAEGSDNPGASTTIEIVADQGARLRAGDRAVLLRYDSAARAYVAAPTEEAGPTPGAA